MTPTHRSGSASFASPLKSTERGNAWPSSRCSTNSRTSIPRRTGHDRARHSGPRTAATGRNRGARDRRIRAARGRRSGDGARRRCRGPRARRASRQDPLGPLPRGGRRGCAAADGAEGEYLGALDMPTHRAVMGGIRLPAGTAFATGAAGRTGRGPRHHGHGHRDDAADVARSAVRGNRCDGARDHDGVRSGGLGELPAYHGGRQCGAAAANRPMRRPMPRGRLA